MIARLAPAAKPMHPARPRQEGGMVEKLGGAERAAALAGLDGWEEVDGRDEVALLRRED